MEFFASPWMLWGAVAGAAPILIHLLNKRKYRQTDWAAMQFLISAVRKQSRRIRLEQLVLLALRVFLLCLLAVALAEPRFADLGFALQADAPTHKIIVIDSTFSMDYRQGNRSRFQEAKEVAREIVEHSSQGDAFNLVRIADSAPQVIVSTPSFRGENIIEEISLLELPHGRGDLVVTLEQIAGLLEPARGVPRLKQVYFISDFQRAGWLPESNSRLVQARTELKEMSRRANLVMIDLGKTGNENSAVTDLRQVDPHVAVGRPTRFQATLQNFGRVPLSGRRLEFLVDGKLRATRRVDIVPGTAASEEFAHTFTAGGEHRLQVRLQEDALPIDDHRWMSVPVREELAVLCVNGSRSGQLMGNATDYLELALRPETPSPGMSSGFQPRVIGSGELAAQDLQGFDCIFLCNVSLITPAEAKILESFLNGGGGVVWCLGDQVEVDHYNDILYREGTGILPVEIGVRRGSAVDRKSAFRFLVSDYSHPIVADFQGNPQAGLNTTLTYEYFQLSLPPQSPAKAVVRFDNGDPAIVDATVGGIQGSGGGHSIVIATSVDDSWGNWPLWPSFLPMVREVAHIAAAGRFGAREFTVNQPLQRALPTGTFDMQVNIVRPGGGRIQVELQRSEEYSGFLYTPTDISGLYEAQFDSPLSRTELFAVNVDTTESDLTSLARDELAAELMPGLSFDYQTDWTAVGINEESHAAAGQIARSLLHLVLYLLFVEQLMAWRFRYGLWALCPPLLLIEAARRVARR